MSFWDKNMEALKQRDKDLYLKLQPHIEQRRETEYEFVTEQARDGSDILGIVKENRKVMLNSTYRPEEEAVKFAGKIIPLPFYLVWVMVRLPWRSQRN